MSTATQIPAVIGHPVVISPRRQVRIDRRMIGRATVAVLMLGLGWRGIRYATDQPLWGDEAYVASTILERDFVGLIRPPEFYQIVPPAFLGVEWAAVQCLGPGEWALRLIPFLAGLASLMLLARFCREVTTPRTTLLAVAILASSFYPVRHSIEVKPYSTDLLISLVLTMTGWAVYRRIESRKRWAGLIATAIVGVWLSYPSVFPAGSVAMLLGLRALQESNQRVRTMWAVFVVLLAANWLLVYKLFAGPQAEAAPFLTELITWRRSFPPIERPWQLPRWLVEVHTGMMVAYPQGGNNYGSTATALFVLAGIVRMVRRPPRRALLMLLLGPLPIALLAATLRRYPYGTSTRVMLYMAPAFCLLAAEGLMALLLRLRRAQRGPIVVASALCVLVIAGTLRDLHLPYFGFDNVVQRRTAARVARLPSAGDLCVVFNGVTPPPAIPDLMITRWLQRVAVARYYLRRDLPVPAIWHPDPNSVRPNPGGRVWLIAQRHGDDRFFSEVQCEELKEKLRLRFGTPQFVGLFDLPNRESWTLWAYPRTQRSDERTMPQ